MKTIITAILFASSAIAAEPRTYDIGDDVIVCIDGYTPMRIENGAKMLRKAKDDRSRESLRVALIGAARRAAERFNEDAMIRLKKMDEAARKRPDPFAENGDK